MKAWYIMLLPSTFGMKRPDGGTLRPELLRTLMDSTSDVAHGDVRNMQTADLTPPVLTSFIMAHHSVDVTSGDAEVIVSWTLVDDISGFSDYYSGGSLAWYSPSGVHVVSAAYNGQAVITKDGTQTTAVCTKKLVFQQYMEPGIWKPKYCLRVEDAVGNQECYNLENLGYDMTVSVTSVQDSEPPQITSFAIAQHSVDVTKGDAELLVTWTLVDEISGFSDYYSGGSLAWYSPNGDHAVSTAYNGQPVITKDGTQTTAVCTKKLVFQQYMEPGIWKPKYCLRVEDAVGNQVCYNLESLGYDIAVAVTSVQDHATPDLVDFHLEKGWINAEEGDAELLVTWTLMDDISGFSDYYSGGSLAWYSPSGQHAVSTEYIGPPVITKEGTKTRAVFTKKLVFHQFMEQGTWKPKYCLRVEDAVGNTECYNLATLGYQTAVTLHDGPDEILPELVDVNLDRTNIDTSSSSANVVVTLSAQDDLSGIDTSVTLTFVGPNGEQMLGVTSCP